MTLLIGIKEIIIIIILLFLLETLFNSGYKPPPPPPPPPLLLIGLSFPNYKLSSADQALVEFHLETGDSDGDIDDDEQTKFKLQSLN